MANVEPPPLFDDDENQSKDVENDDLFTSAQEDLPNNKSAVIEDKEDIFAEHMTSEVPLDSPEPEKKDDSKPDTDEPLFDDPPKMGVTESSTNSAMLSATSAVTNTNSVSSESNKQKSMEEVEEEGGDQFNIEINVTDPKKMGDGMNAYMAYKVNTKTTLPEFKKQEMGVYRRFSDFLGLHDKMVEKYQHQGRIIPPPPEKSVIGMTKIKMSKEEAGSQDFVEKRRAALERFVNRVGKHPTLRHDPSFKEFLEMDGELPKSTSTSALSGAGVMRLFSRVGDSFGKITFKMDETDQLNIMRTYFCQPLPIDDGPQWNSDFEWFEEKQQQIEALDQQLRKLHSSIEALVAHRKELAVNTGVFAKSAAMLANAEEHTALSRALSQLAEVEEKLDTLHLDQADADFFVFSELIKDYINLITSIKEVFHERVKIFKIWKESEMLLTKKREARAKLELARKLDKIPQVSQEITELELRVEKGQEEFELISKNIRKEVERFEKQRVKDFKATIINYLEALMNSQQQVIKYWETFVPEAKAIA